MFKKLINRIDNINSPVKRTLFVSGVFGFLGVLISIVFLGSFYVMFVGVESYIVPMNRYSLLVSGIETGFYGFLNGFSVRSVINLLFILVAISVVLFIFLYALLFVISKIHAIRALKLARWRSILFIIIGFGLLVLITEAITVDQRKLSFPRFFYETLLFGLLFVFTAGGGYINCLSMDKGALALKYRLGENPLLGSLVRGIVAGIITLSIISLLNHYYSYVYEYLNFSFHLNGIDYSYFTQNFIFTGVFFTVYAFISGGVLSAMMPSGISLRDRIKSLAVPLSVTIIFALACFIVETNTKEKWDMVEESLNEAASLIVLDEEPAPRIALALADKSNYKGKEVKLRDTVYEWPLPVIDLIPENLEKLDAYLGHIGDRDTYFKYSVLTAREIIARRNWMAAARRVYLEEMLVKGNNAVGGIQFVSNLRNAPATEENRKLLITLSDEEFFYIGEKMYSGFMYAWDSFGEYDEAMKWYERAKDVEREKWQKEPREPRKFVFIDGMVEGRVSGITTEGVRVGIFPTNEKVKRFVLSEYSMADAKELRSDGTFIFDHLKEGWYYIGVLLPSGEVGPFDISGGGKFKLDKDNPSKDFGIISIKKSN